MTNYISPRTWGTPQLERYYYYYYNIKVEHGPIPSVLQTSYCWSKIECLIESLLVRPLQVQHGAMTSHDSPGSALSPAGLHLQRGPADAEVRGEDRQAELSPG